MTSNNINSGTLFGVKGFSVQVEVDLLRKLPGVSIIGLPDGAVRESADRVRSAIQNSGFIFPRKKIIINLAPAGLRKTGTRFDLAIAIGILFGDKQIDPTVELDTILFIGELALSGQIRAIKGALPITLMAMQNGFKTIIVPKENIGEIQCVDINIVGCSSLVEVVHRLVAGDLTSTTIANTNTPSIYHPDMSDVRAQQDVKRALEIAASGGHNILLMGSPGCGKSMLAKRMPSILPTLSIREAIDVTCIHSVAGTLELDGLVHTRPFRSPHHSISLAGMIGTAKLQPGEITLAHHGVLFLDEIAEFRRDVLESLRTPLEDGTVNITRASGHIRFPAQCSIIASANPCPCGWKHHPTKRCTCSLAAIQRYENRLSGPLLDRIDLHIWVNPVPTQIFMSEVITESSHKIRERVEEARNIQKLRYRNIGITSNAQLSGNQIWSFIKLKKEYKEWFVTVSDQQKLSARAMSRVLKVARTIADIEGGDCIQKMHIIEAFGYRNTIGEQA